MSEREIGNSCGLVEIREVYFFIGRVGGCDLSTRGQVNRNTREREKEVVLRCVTPFSQCGFVDLLRDLSFFYS